jgi:hypothetical protein
MTATQILLLVAGILLIQAIVWIGVSRWVRRKTTALMAKMCNQCTGAGNRTVFAPTSALYRGADARFGNVKGNGVICLTENALWFEKLTGQCIVIDREEIVQATVESTFKGKVSFGTGGKHLVIRTRDGNRVGFLIKGAEAWRDALNAQ